MISVNDAQGLLKANLLNKNVTTVELDQAIGKTLAQDILSERDAPPFNRAMLDGIAVNLKTLKSGQTKFSKEKRVRAGEAKSSLEDLSKCIEIMTGSVLPNGCDLVIPYEDLSEDETSFTFIGESIPGEGSAVHKIGTDALKGDVILNLGTRIGASEIGIIISNGLSCIDIFENPRIAIISTGDELVEINETPLAHQIRRSNPFAIAALIEEFNLGKADLFHLKDNEVETIKKINELVLTYDGLIFSGGVSKGKFDFIPKALTECGFMEVFHRVAQKPGKPLLFSKSDSKFVFGLPGNPVSSLVCARRFVVPFLSGEWKIKEIKLSEDFTFKKNLTYFLPVELDKDGRGRPKKMNTSGDFSSLGGTDGFIELPANQETFKADESFNFYPWSLH